MQLLQPKTAWDTPPFCPRSYVGMPTVCNCCGLLVTSMHPQETGSDLQTCSRKCTPCKACPAIPVVSFLTTVDCPVVFIRHNCTVFDNLIFFFCRSEESTGTRRGLHVTWWEHISPRHWLAPASGLHRDMYASMSAVDKS